MLQKVDTKDLRVGMYVASLDRPWVDSPFLFQGFFIKDQADIEELQKHCVYVNIDPSQGVAPDYSIQSPAPVSAPPPPATARQHAAPAQDSATLFAMESMSTAPPLDFSRPPAAPVHKNFVPVTEEMEFARQAHSIAQQAMKDVMDDARAGRKLNSEGVREAVSGMVESILRNPDAFHWLSLLKDRDNYTYAHSISTATLGIAFGRHMGLPKEELEAIGTGTLLFDIGKTRVPEEILSKQERLSPEELAEVRRHVDYSVQIMSETRGISQQAVEIAHCHHERHDGRGYPRGLKGDGIPVYGRMAAIVDCYDAITRSRAYAHAISPHEAVRKLYEWRNIDFQEEVVEQFIQCLGAYPIGTLVELTTAQVGIILSQNRVRRLRPRLMLVLDAQKQPYEISPVVDLLTETEDASGKPLEIARALEAGAYGIDPREFYL